MKMFNVLSNVQLILFAILVFFFIYQLIICVFAFTKERKKPKIIDKKHRFMAVISARNEETVIGNLIKSLKKQTYELLDVYVIADNCTDNTAAIAREEGAIVYERFDTTRRSKGYALEWFFDKILSEKPDDYDVFCIFDADNIVSEDFFEKMNERFCQGETIVQGYRDIKNPGDTWVSACYAIFYWTMNRCYHYARYNLGLSPMVNGTGFAVSMSILKETNGWHSDTLTEDIEFSMENISKGRKIGWAQEAVVYDEQPLKFAQSCRQRLRWSVGHIQCFQKFFAKLLNNENKDVTIFDTIIYTLGMPMIFVSIIIGFIDVLKISLNSRMGYIDLLEGMTFTMFTLLVTILQALVVTIIEKKDIKKVWKGIVTYPIFLLSWFMINIVAFFNTKLEWKPIAHIGSKELNQTIK